MRGFICHRVIWKDELKRELKKGCLRERHVGAGAFPSLKELVVVNKIIYLFTYVPRNYTRSLGENAEVNRMFRSVT